MNTGVNSALNTKSGVALEEPLLKPLSEEFTGKFARVPDRFKVSIPLEGTDATSLRHLPIGEKSVGKYHIQEFQNVTVIAFVDETRSLHLAPYTAERLFGLKEAGYSQELLPIPGDGPRFPGSLQGELRAQLLMLIRAAKDEKYYETREGFKRLLKDRAEQLGIRPVAGLERDWLCVDGMEFRHFASSTTDQFPSDVLSKDGAPRHELLNAVGKFCTNNGMLAFVSPEGKTYVALFTKEKREYLISKGYQEGGLFVPFSNGEVPVKPDDSSLLSEIRTADSIQRRGW